MTDRTPTDPAPRGADAPDFDEASHHAAVLRNTLINFVGTESVIARCAVMNDAPERISTIEALFNLARAYLALRSPVPAEATSGAWEHPCETLDGLEAEMAKQAALGHKQFCIGVHVWDHGEQAEWVEWPEAFARLAALRTPPAPLPREGAMVERVAEMLASYRRVTQPDDCLEVGGFDDFTEERKEFTREYARSILAALTPAAPTTTKETR